MSGTEVWRGPSAIDGSPIVAIATGGSKNRETGDMLQVWILRQDADPVTAIRTGKDSAICGGCPHRGSAGVRTCYVNVGQAPLAVWRAWRSGAYRRGIAPAGPCRIGAYGDPAALPYAVVRDLADRPETVTGYTHQWRRCDRRLQQWVQASCDSPADAIEAAADGWRTFLVRPADYVSPGVWDRAGDVDMVECMSDAKGLQCVDCGLCNGRTQHVWVRAHGGAKAYV